MAFDLAEIGPVLKAGREQRKLTLDDVSKALFIRKSIISAIESGNWEVLPHAVYVRGYILQYASFLNILDEIAPRLAPANEPATPGHLKGHLSDGTEGVIWPKSWRNVSKTIGTIGMACIVAAFLVFQNVGIREAPPSARDNAALNNYHTVSTEKHDTHIEKPILDTKKLIIACRERTWVRVVIDGAEKKEFMMNPEEAVVFNAKEKFDLLIGNAGGVKLFYNGKDTGFTGENGEVKRITLS